MLLCKKQLEGKPLTRIYTRTGDDGTTDLIGKQRVAKDSPCIETIGALDELNALLGVVRSSSLPNQVDSVLQDVQEQLFILSAEIATPSTTEPGSIRIGDEDIRNLEAMIDTYDSYLKPLQQFILPGGSPAGAHLHLTRTIVRRVERLCVALFRSVPADPQILRYLNRLSDLCFVLARYVNLQQSIPEKHPTLRRLS
jgi:cob(I)alamin adenosyltransferase